MARELPQIGEPEDAAPSDYADVDHGHDYVPIESPNVDITAVHSFKPRQPIDDPPFKTISQVWVENLNADLLDGQHASEFAGVEIIIDLEARITALEAELAKIEESNELLRRILAEVTKQSVQLAEATDVRPTDEDVKEVWQ